MLDGTRQQVLCYHMFMASRKPKGIADDIVGAIRNIVSPWLGTPPNPALSEELNNKIAQVQGLTRGAAETLDQAFAGGMVKAGVQGNKALAKQAAVNAAALGTGYVAAKVVQKGTQVIASGIKEGKYVNPVAAIENFVKGNKIIMHSSSQQGLPLLKPVSGSIAMPRDQVLFGWNPRSRRSLSSIDRPLLNFTNPKNPEKGGTRTTGANSGSVYVASIPKKSAGPVVTNKKIPNKNRMIVSTSPGKIISEIPAPSTRMFDEYDPNSYENYLNFQDRLGRELRKAGVLPKQIPLRNPKRR